MIGPDRDDYAAIGMATTACTRLEITMADVVLAMRPELDPNALLGSSALLSRKLRELIARLDELAPGLAEKLETWRVEAEELRAERGMWAHSLYFVDDEMAVGEQLQIWHAKSRTVRAFDRRQVEVLASKLDGLAMTPRLAPLLDEVRSRFYGGLPRPADSPRTEKGGGA